MYLIDADVLIDSKSGNFGFDICPGFWDWLIDANRRDVVFSIDAVREELLRGEDELAEWVAERDDHFFLKPDPITCAASLRATATWVNGNTFFSQTAKSVFLSGADYFLVAQAHALRFHVVTNESISDSPKILRIPNACDGMGVTITRLPKVLRHLGAKFVRSPE